MRKNISVLLAAVMLTAVFALAVSAAPKAQTSAPKNDGAVKFVSATAKTSEYMTDRESECTLSVVNAGSGKVFSVKRKTAGDNSLFVEPESLIDARNTQWLEFWLDVNEVEVDGDTFYLAFRVFDGLGAVSDNFGGGGYLEYKYMGSDGKWEETVLDEWGRMGFPAKFSGYVRINLKQLTSYASPYAGNGKTLDLQYIQKIGVWSDNGKVGNAMYFNDFRFVKDKSAAGGESSGEVVEPAAPTQPEAPANAGATDFVNGKTSEIIGVNEGVQEVNSVASGNKTLIKVKTLRPAGEAGINAAVEPVDASGKRYLEFWIDTSIAAKTRQLGLGMRLFDADGAVADSYGADGKIEYWLYENGKWVNYGMENAKMTLPLGYKGYVRLDVSQFRKCVTNYIGNGKPADLSKIKGIWLWWNVAEEQVGQSVYVNDLRFVNATAGSMVRTNPGTGSAITACAVLAAAVALAGAYTASKKKNR